MTTEQLLNMSRPIKFYTSPKILYHQTNFWLRPWFLCRLRSDSDDWRLTRGTTLQTLCGAVWFHSPGGATLQCTAAVLASRQSSLAVTSPFNISTPVPVPAWFPVTHSGESLDDVNIPPVHQTNSHVHVHPHHHHADCWVQALHRTTASITQRHSVGRLGPLIINCYVTVVLRVCHGM